jgi:dienelactone hydrolase
MPRLPHFLRLAPLLLLVACATTPTEKQQQANADKQVSRQQDPLAARSEFLQLLNRPRVPLAPDVAPATPADGLSLIRITNASQAGVRVPGILLKPTDPPGAAPARRPVVIALHGTGENKNSMLPFLRQCAAKGFIGVAIDGRYHGERGTAAPRTGDLDAYNLAILDAYCDTPRLRTTVFGPAARPPEEPFFPLYYDTVWDVMRLVDFLRMREDVDPARIGLYGVSKGGIETYLAAAADPRIAVAVPAIAVQTFRFGLKNNAWQGRVATVQPAFDAAAKATGIDKPDWHFVEVFYDRVMPGIIDTFDGPGMLPLIAPRPLLVINSDNDRNTPFEGVKIAVHAAQDAYLEAQPPVPDHFQQIVQPGAGHRVLTSSQSAALDWFTRWLQP